MTSDGPNTKRLFPNGRWLMCWPKYFDVTYEINPWMKVTYKPSARDAWLQWQNLHHTIVRLGGWVDYIEPLPNQPDMVFTANGGLVKGKKCLLSHFRFKERMGEEPAFKNWFLDQGFEVKELSQIHFEGEGDALFAGTRLYTGAGFRSDAAVVGQIKEYFGLTDVVSIELVDPYYYHLDTCFCPLNESQALYTPQAFSKASLELLQKSIDLIEVPIEEARLFACNAVVLGKAVIIPAGASRTCTNLVKAGFEPHELQLSEFIKSGGAAKCLTMKLEQ